MAVILGIEVDNLFNCKADVPGQPASLCPNMPAHPELDTVQKAIDFYYDWGVRHVFPVHNFNNKFAGTATWLDPLAAGGRFVEKAWPETQDCASTPGFESGYGFRHENFSVDLIWLLACSVSNTALSDPACDGSLSPIYGDQTTCNAQGLTAAGVDLVDRLMAKGMLIDIDHMSNESLNDTLNMAEGMEPLPYPLVASHGLFFDLHNQVRGDDDPPFGGAGQQQGREGRHERLRTRAQLDRLAAIDSVVAVMTMSDVQITDRFRERHTIPYAPGAFAGLPGTTIEDDCLHSTKSFAQSYEYAVDVMGGSVALGTDFNGVAAHIGPRFGGSGCGGEDPVINLQEDRIIERSAQERFTSRLGYPFTNEFGTFHESITGQKVFDFNTDGLAHVGLLPDMLADMKVIGFSDQDLEPLFTSANKYIEVWEQANNEICVPEPDGGLPIALLGLATLGAMHRRRGVALKH